MIFPAVVSLMVYATLLGLIGYYGLKSGRPTLLSAAIILTLLTVVRQLIFLFGLDVPSPQSHFGETEWALMVLANIVSITWISVLMGVYLAFGPASRILTPLLPPGPNYAVGESPVGLKLVVWAPALFAILGTLYLIIQEGGVANFVYASKISKDLKGLFIFKDASILASVLAIYAFILSLKRKAGRTVLSASSYGYIFVMVSVLAANYAWGNRYNIALSLILLIFVWHYFVRKLNIFRFAAIAVMAFVCLTMLRDLRGELIAASQSRVWEANENFWLSLSASLHFNQFDAYMLALRDAGNLFDFRNGRDFLNGLLSWVPRSIYEDKENFHVGQWFRQVYQPSMRNGWPVTTMGSWYVNFGWAGIFIGATISGAVLRVVDAAYSNVRSNPWHAAVGLGLAFFMTEGGLNTGFPQRIFILVIPLWLASFWLRQNLAPKRRTGQGWQKGHPRHRNSISRQSESARQL